LPCISVDLAKFGDTSRAAEFLGLHTEALHLEPDDYHLKGHPLDAERQL
jgi:hypothetical protein